MIICCDPNWEVTPSILEHSYVVMLLLYQRLDLALKSPRMTVRKGLFVMMGSRFSLMLLINDSKSSVLAKKGNPFLKRHFFEKKAPKNSSPPIQSLF